jgi:hypothetical protein
MGYNTLVYRIGKLYGRMLQEHPEVEYPKFAGLISDLLDDAALRALPALHGERVIAYNNGQGTDHFIRVYFDEGTFEAQGTPALPGFFNLSTNIAQD